MTSVSGAALLAFRVRVASSSRALGWTPIHRAPTALRFTCRLLSTSTHTRRPNHPPLPTLLLHHDECCPSVGGFQQSISHSLRLGRLLFFIGGGLCHLAVGISQRVTLGFCPPLQSALIPPACPAFVVSAVSLQVRGFAVPTSWGIITQQVSIRVSSRADTPKSWPRLDHTSEPTNKHGVQLRSSSSRSSSRSCGSRIYTIPTVSTEWRWPGWTRW